MIIFGTTTKRITTETVTDKCLNCESRFTIQLNIFQRYVHIFWIPFLPAGKIGVTKCTHCQEVLEQSNFTYSLTETYQSIESNSKTPIWTFSGLALLTLIIAGGLFYNKKNQERNAKIILSPERNDVYEIKLSDQNYTLYKVHKVIGDSVFLTHNKFETNSLTGIDDLEEKGYSEEIFSIFKGDLKNMFEKGEIIEVRRK
jgi:hypothetical protein